jgi:hypothetical protein
MALHVPIKTYLHPVFCLLTSEQDYDACITAKKLAIKFTFSWFPMVIIRVAEVFIINTAFSATRLLTFA